MTRRSLLIRRSALAVAIGVAAALLGHLLVTPATGDVLLLLTARQPDRIAATSVDLHSAQGWMTLGSIPSRPVPQPPDTAVAFLTRLPVGGSAPARLPGVSSAASLALQ